MRPRSPSSSPAFSSAFEPPEPLATHGWFLEPLRPELAELDYVAWRSCRERLVRELQWGGWPGPDFSFEDNVADLADHFREFQCREAFAYSVLTPERCIGCVYIEPWARGAQLAFWVVDDCRLEEPEIVDRVLSWLERDWPFEEVLVPVMPSFERGLKLLRGMGLVTHEGPTGRVSFIRSELAN